MTFDDMLSLVATCNLKRILRVFPDCKVHEFLKKYNGCLSGSAALFLLNPWQENYPLGSDLDIYIPSGTFDGESSHFMYEGSDIIVSNESSAFLPYKIVKKRKGLKQMFLDTTQLEMDAKLLFLSNTICNESPYVFRESAVHTIFSLFPSTSTSKIDVVISAYGLSVLHTIMDFDMTMVSNCVFFCNQSVRVVCGDIRAVSQRKMIYNSQLHKANARYTNYDRQKKYSRRGYSLEDKSIRRSPLYANIVELQSYGV
jgi:hypothetical protein